MVEAVEVREIIYTEKPVLPGEEPIQGVRFTIENNRVIWQEFPRGEIGEAWPNQVRNGVELFIGQTARLLGYPSRLALVCELLPRATDMERLHKNGRIPAGGKILKADVF